MFYGYVGYVHPGDATRQIMIDSAILIALYTFLHWFAFEPMHDWLRMYFMYSPNIRGLINWVFEVLSYNNVYGETEYDLGASAKMATYVWLVTTPIILMYRGFRLSFPGKD